MGFYRVLTSRDNYSGLTKYEMLAKVEFLKELKVPYEVILECGTKSREYQEIRI